MEEDKQDKLLSEAVNSCIEIYMDFSSLEVCKEAPCIVNAWQAGKDIAHLRNKLETKVN